MKVKELQEYLMLFNDDAEIFIRNSMNICGNISELDQLEKTEYGCFGTLLPCLVLNSSHSIKESDGKFPIVIETSGKRGNEEIKIIVEERNY